MREQSQKIIGTMPKLKAADAASLRKELKDLRRYMNDAKISDRRTWFKKIRNNVEGVAATEFEYVLAHDFGGESAYQAKLADPDPPFPASPTSPIAPPPPDPVLTVPEVAQRELDCSCPP